MALQVTSGGVTSLTLRVTAVYHRVAYRLSAMSIDTRPKRKRGFLAGPCPSAGTPSLTLRASMLVGALLVYAAHE